MPSKREAEGYASLAGDAYRSLIGAVEAVNYESLEYLRSIFGIVARPYPSLAPRAIAREQIQRSAALISATIESLEAANGHAAELARELAGIVTVAHETYVEALRGVAEASVSNAAFVKDALSRNASLKLPSPSLN